MALETAPAGPLTEVDSDAQQIKTLLHQNQQILLALQTSVEQQKLLTQKIPLILQQPLEKLVVELQKLIREELMSALEELLNKEKPEKSDIGQILKDLTAKVEAETGEILQNREHILENGENVLENLGVSKEIRASLTSSLVTK